MKPIIDNMIEQIHSLEPKTRKLIIFSTAVALILAVAYSSLNTHVKTLVRKKISREQTLKELMVLRQRYQEASAEAQQLTNRMAAVTAGDNPATIIEQTGFVPKGSIQSKPLPRQERGSVVEEGADVTISGISLNEAVNLLQQIEHGPKPLSIKKGNIRARFNEPSKLDLTLQLALFRSSVNQEKR